MTKTKNDKRLKLNTIKQNIAQNVTYYIEYIIIIKRKITSFYTYCNGYNKYCFFCQYLGFSENEVMFTLSLNYGEKH